MVGVALVGLSLLAGAGFRNDSGAYPDAAAPQLSAPRWRVPLSGWSNASPTVVGGVVCTQTEPTRLSCHDRASGREVWSAPNDVVDALDAASKVELGARLREVAEQVALLPKLMSEASALRRQLRAGATPELSARLATVSDRIVAIDQLQVAYDPYLTPPNRQTAGWSMPTPWTDGRSLWTLFGNGVLSRFEADGRRTWGVWLGPGQKDFRGWTIDAGPTSTASLRLVDGVLLVPHGKLRGVDPATGDTRWTGPVYTDFGTPAVARVAGAAAAVTPDGTVVRVRDGRTLARGLGDIYFVGPVADGDRVWFVGGKTANHAEELGIVARALRLVPSGADAVRAEVLWQTDLPERARVFAQPLVADGRVWVVQESGTVTVLDANTGVSLASMSLGGGQGDGFYSSPVAAAGAVWLGDQGGRLHEVRLSGSTLSSTPHTVDGMRASAVFDKDQLYLRTFSALWAFGPR